MEYMHNGRRGAPLPYGYKSAIFHRRVVTDVSTLWFGGSSRSNLLRAVSNQVTWIHHGIQNFSPRIFFFLVRILVVCDIENVSW